MEGRGKVNAYPEEGALQTTLRLTRRQMISSTEMARRFAEYLDRASERNERLFITRNNEIEGVLLGIEDFERLLEIEEIAEHLSIARLVEARKHEGEVIDLEALLREEGLDPDELGGVESD